MLLALLVVAMIALTVFSRVFLPSHAAHQVGARNPTLTGLFIFLPVFIFGILGLVILSSVRRRPPQD
jgi:amino acid permease